MESVWPTEKKGFQAGQEEKKNPDIKGEEKRKKGREKRVYLNRNRGYRRILEWALPKKQGPEAGGKGDLSA